MMLRFRFECEYGDAADDHSPSHQDLALRTLLRLGAVSITLAVLCATLPAQAQNERVNVTGMVVDTSGVGLPHATVVVLTRADSVLAKFATSRHNGEFNLRRVTPGAYILQITYVGFNTLRQELVIGSVDVDVGAITLHALTTELDEIIVTADQIPIVVKRDTLEYNANAFETRPGDVVEDLLRKLPGVDVNEDGTITAQGEVVQNVLVDGKEFFPETPSVATKELPAKAIDKVQVYDKASDQAEFTGIPDGHEEKTIDLKLKEDAKRGVMGRITGALGGEQSPVSRYEGSTSIHRFSPLVQLSTVGNFSNAGGGSFATAGAGMIAVAGAEIMSSGFGGSGGGISESWSAGANASRNFTKSNYIRSSYRVSSVDNTQDSNTQRQEFAGLNTPALRNEASLRNSEDFNHRVSLTAQRQFSPGHRIRVRSSLRINSGNMVSTRNQKTLGSRNLLLNDATTDHDTEDRSLNGSASVTWRKKIADNGRSIVASNYLSLSDSDRYSDLLTRTGLFASGNVMTWEEVQQEQERFTNSISDEQRLSLTEPLTDELSVEVFGEREARRRQEDKRYYDLNEGFRTLDSELSDDFERTYSYYRAGTRLSLDRESDRITVNLNVRRTSLRGTFGSQKPDVKSKYTHFLPSLSYRYKRENNSTINVRYGTSTREPSLQQLQPYTDNDNPLRIYRGNPHLVPQYSHSISGSYRFFDAWTLVTVFASARVTHTRNRIVQTRTIDESLRQTVSPINSGRGWTSGNEVSFGMPIRPLGVEINVSNDLTLSTGTEILNSLENESRTLRNSTGVRVSNRNQDIVAIRGRFTATFNKVDYSRKADLEQQYINTTLSISASWYPKKVWTVRTDMRYRTYDRDVFGSARNVAILNLSLSRELLANRARLALSVRDLLNQNQGISFSNTGAYIQERRVATLGRHLLLRFSYRLNVF